MAKLISQVYGHAVFSAALEAGTIDNVYEEAVLLADIFKNNSDLNKLMSAPSIVKEDKIKIIMDIFGNKLSNELAGTISTAIMKGRQKEIVKILEYVISEIKDYKKIGVAYVTSAFNLDDTTKLAIKEKLLATTKYNDIEINYNVDKDIIAGLVIRIKDRVIDSSVRTKIEDIKRDLYNIQLT